MFQFIVSITNCFSNTDSVEIQNLNKLFLQYEYVNADSAKFYNDLALEMSISSDCKACLSDVYLYRGYYFDDSGNIDSALFYLNKAMKTAEIISDTARIAKVFNNYGYLYSHTGDFDKALTNYMEFLRLEENVIKDSSQICAAFLNIGNVHLSLKEYKEALPYYEVVDKYFFKSNEKVRLGFVYNSLAIAHQYKNERDLELALRYYNKSLEVKKEVNDQSGIPLTMSNIASLYFDRGEYEKSLESYLEAIPLLENINDAYNLCSVYKNTGMVYRKKGDLENSEFYFNKSLVVANKIDSKFYLSEIYSELSILFQIANKPYKALINLRKHIQYKDSILGEENIANIRELEAVYEKDKKEKEIELLHKENQLKALEISKQNQLKIIFGICFLIMLFIAFIIYRNFLNKKRANKIIEEQKKNVEEINEELNQTNEELAAQRDEIERQKEIVEEAHKEITDSIIYAKRIQNAILPAPSLIKDTLPESFILYLPKDVVAGDFYWLEQVVNTTLFAVADCTGHGVPGAMVSVVCHNAMNRAVREFGLTKPGLILDKTLEIVVAEFEKSEDDVKDGMDIALCSLSGNILQYAGAHNPLWIIRNNEIIETKADKQPIGKFDKSTPYKTHTIELQKGDSIYIFSDGYADQFGGEKDKKFGSKRFKQLLISIHNKSMSEQKEILKTTFEDWIKQGGGEQIDDVCVMGVKV